MVAEAAAAASILFKQSVSVQYQFRVSQSSMEIESAAPSVLSKSPTTAIFHASESAVSFEIPRSESVCPFNSFFFFLKKLFNSCSLLSLVSSEDLLYSLVLHRLFLDCRFDLVSFLNLPLFN